MTQENSPEQEEESTEEKFASAYEGASITSISYDELPEEAAKEFEARSRSFILDEEYVSRNFSRLYLLTHPSGSETYIAEQTKTIGDADNNHTEELVYLLDFVDGKPAGFGELRHNISNPSEYYKGKPYVGYTQTYSQDDKGVDQDYRKKGFGFRRLAEMDAYARARFSAPLHSSSSRSPEAERVWERLVEEGRAEAYLESKTNKNKESIRYRMK